MDIAKFVQKLNEMGEDVSEADFSVPEVSPDEKVNAQLLYTAIMTGTLLEEEGE